MLVGIHDIWTYIVGTVLIILLPGPNSLYVLSVAARQGLGRGYQAALGVAAGDSVLMFLSAAGVASLLRSTPVLFSTVKYLGALYLAWIGLNLLRQGWRMLRPVDKEQPATAADEAAADEAAVANGRGPFLKAMFICLLNPKSILFFVAFFIQFVDSDYDKPALSFLILAAIVQIVSLTYLSTLIFTGTFLAERFRRYRRTSAGATSGIGMLFLGFGLKLATASL